MRCKKLEMVSSAFKRKSKIRSGTCEAEKKQVLKPLRAIYPLQS